MHDRPARVTRKPHARGREVVEAVRVADVLHSRGIADAAAYALAARAVAETARQRDRVSPYFPFGHRDVGARTDDVSDGSASLHRLTCDGPTAVAKRLCWADAHRTHG